MSKFIKLFYVALFATLTLPLASCSNDDDEPNDPNEQPGGGNDSEMKVFIANDVQYYYPCYNNGAPMIGSWDDSNASVGAEFSITAWSVIGGGYSYPSDVEDGTKIELKISVSESINNMTDGKKLTLVTYEGTAYSFGWLHKWNASCRYMVNSGEIYCESKSGNVITLRLNDLLLTRDKSYNDTNYQTLPASVKVSGIVKYKKASYN
ncbi:MAG: hypothetical protein K2M94_05350 [Paramuribaculum sp.]|nr:hypothetical protein [Paramuribaculum sp.]